MMLGMAGGARAGRTLAVGRKAGLRRDALVPRGAPVLVAVLTLVAGATFIAGLAAERSTTHMPRAGLAQHRGLSGLPLAAQGAISAKLGADSRAYRVHATAAGLQATSPAQLLRLHFDRSGVAVASGALKFGLGLRAVGYGQSVNALGNVVPSAKANRVSYAHPGLDEWYVNGPLGLEQGFTLARAPAPYASGPLTLSMALSGNVRAALAANGQSLTLGHQGTSALRYTGLTAIDARGHTLHSWFQLQDGTLLLRVDAHGAHYPLRIDPFVQQGSKLTGSGEVGAGKFGSSVALSADGNTALIGGSEDNKRVGAVWVFTRSGSTWTQQGEKLTGSGEVGEGVFGSSVALSADGSTALIGGVFDGAGKEGSVGAAWVFTRSGSTWTQQGSKLRGSGEIGSGDFGSDVALSSDGNTALIGGSTDNSFAGAAWVFTRAGSTWTQQGEKLTGSGASGKSEFGSGVALSADGNTALIGGSFDNAAPGGNGVGAAWVFTRAGSTWTQQGEKLTGSGEVGEGVFGSSVALSSGGNTALMGGYLDNGGAGAAWVFTRSGSTWTQQGSKFTGSGASGTSEFGDAVGLSADGNTALIGGFADKGLVGAAWIFTRSGPTWTQQGEKLTGSGESGAAWFGISVALSPDGGTALIGGYKDNSDVGAAWVFANNAPTITKVSPKTGPVVGGTTVKITGMNFTGATLVKFGSTSAASFTVTSASAITAVSPAEPAGTVDVRVTTSLGGTSAISSADRFKFAPTVTGLSPNSGPKAGGTSVIVTGTGFALGTTAPKFKFGTTLSKSVNCTSSTKCTVLAPAHAVGTIDVKATVNKVSSAKNAPADQFTYN